MKDFHFWLGLPYVLQGALSTPSIPPPSLKQDLENLENRIRETKNQLNAVLKANSNSKEPIPINVRVLLQDLELQRNRIMAGSINATLQSLKDLVNRLEQYQKMPIEALQVGMKVSRVVIKKAMEEMTACKNEREMTLYMMLKVYGEKCLEKFVGKINEVLMEIEQRSNDADSVEEENEDNGENEDNAETSTTYTTKSYISNFSKGDTTGKKTFDFDCLI